MRCPDCRENRRPWQKCKSCAKIPVAIARMIEIGRRRRQESTTTASDSAFSSDQRLSSRNTSIDSTPTSSAARSEASVDQKREKEKKREYEYRHLRSEWYKNANGYVDPRLVKYSISGF